MPLHTTSRRTARLLTLPLLAALAWLPSGAASAQQPSKAQAQQPSPAMQILTDEAHRLQANDAALRQQHWQAAADEAARIVEDTVDKLNHGGEQIIGVALLQRALALSGLGKMEDARWYAELCRSYYPAIGPGTVNPFGDTGAALKDALENPTDELFDGAHIVVPSGGSAPGVTPPAPTVNPSLVDKDAAEQAGVQGQLAVRFIVDQEGRPRYPHLDQGLNNALDWHAFESLKQWRFTPATKDDGTKVPYLFTAAVNLTPSQPTGQ